MRGDDQQQDGMFSYISPDKRVPQDHPLRMIRSLVDGVLEQLSPRFNRLYQSVAEVVFVTAPRVESQWRTAGQSGDLGVGSDVLS